ncbi:MAG: hypothetical protein ABSA02_14350 [Trebonia sp.]|jgi:hypothetical protein
MMTGDQPGLGWTVVLRRQPARIVEGRPEGGYTDAFEIVCCDCGDHPDLDYTEVSAELRRIRGPYLITDGVAAYVAHVGRYHQPAPAVPRQRMPATDPNRGADLAASGLTGVT